MSTNRLYLLDAFALIYRAYYAMQNAHLYSQEGFNTGAVMGFVNTLETVLNRTDVTHIAVCFDPRDPRSAMRLMPRIRPSGRRCPKTSHSPFR